MSTDHVSKPRRANQSIAEESVRPGTCRSKVGCEAMEEPCTNRMVPAFGCAVAGFSHRNRRTSPLSVQCSVRSEEHTSELQSPCNLVCRLLLEKKKKQTSTSC